ncbi:MAG TPA: hypothetical protein VGM56_19690 [Byssovorax sp.]|jgi:hypothetical protein
MADPKVTGHNVEGWHRANAIRGAYQDDEVTGKDPLAIFDELLPTGSDYAKPKFTSIAFNKALAAQNRLELSVRVDDVVGPDTTMFLYVFVETSADGRRWIQRSNQTNIFDTDDADITVASAASYSTVAYWSDACVGQSKFNGFFPTSAGPLLSYVRLRLFFDAVDWAAHVRVYAHGAHRKKGAST